MVMIDSIWQRGGSAVITAAAAGIRVFRLMRRARIDSIGSSGSAREAAASSMAKEKAMASAAAAA